MPIDMTKIRNVALLGHSGSGKTSVADAMLYLVGGNDRLGSTAAGNSAFDTNPEEIKRKISVSAGFAPIEWNGIRINVIDTPGTADFAGEVAQALRVADAAIIVLDAKAGIEVGTELAWDAATEAGIPKAFFLNKSDDPEAHYDKVLDALRERFGSTVCPVTVPLVQGGKLAGDIDLVEMKGHIVDAKGKATDAPIPDEDKDAVAAYRDILMEAVAATSEELMEKFFGGEEMTREEIHNAVHEGVVLDEIVPCYCGCAVKMWGIPSLLTSIAESFPRPNAKPEKDVNGNDVEIRPDGEPAVFVFKTVADSFAKMNFFKVMSGTLKPDAVLKNARTGDAVKFAKLYQMKGKTGVEVPELCCGDIGYTTKLTDVATCDTLSLSGKTEYAKIDFPLPFYTKAIKPLAKGDEDKISTGIGKLTDEDMTLKYEVNKETAQMLLSGLGGTHLDVALAKLKANSGVGVELIPKKIAYRETIRKSCKVEGKHKKQSGGHGQYGHVKIEFSPGTEPGLTFTESIFGGSVPKNFHPAVEKGLQECMSRGVLAGYPVVNLAANLYDGSYHEVDSNEMSFKMAAAIAFREGLPQCAPVLLEPVGELKVLIPDGQMGDVIGDLNKRRGRILGTDQSPDKRGYSIVDAEVPEAEMDDYVHTLRAMSQGRASFTYYFKEYQEVPGNVAEKVIEAAKKEKAE